jgi:hypothetical protein
LRPALAGTTWLGATGLEHPALAGTVLPAQNAPGCGGPSRPCPVGDVDAGTLVAAQRAVIDEPVDRLADGAGCIAVPGGEIVGGWQSVARP